MKATSINRRIMFAFRSVPSLRPRQDEEERGRQRHALCRTDSASGLESNWIPTGGKRPMPTFRFYGPEEPFYNKTFKMPDFERVD